ncbi:hypothetical protein AYO21_11255 [Fonsecaea monophora]|uniref:Zn(2)-C6 fungal-type domain-containing protein n=1 Tax=Fonsecaea monophora TaxID=254056 RepID=A0A177ETI0_9EURO|nr:hypothetical protein AYO21_11255 [Fonsecaea monophora]KAH0846461.1 hypothetical protein FOPE_11227 [Fonsecaea pedrosoi]OAG34610.1 hypothetical protein AYO21_11255 [Fonsecaea monophora]
MSWMVAIQPSLVTGTSLSPQSSTTGVDATPPTSSKRKYTSTACEYCRFKRKRCDGQPRCRTCVDANKQCVYRFNDKRKASVRQEEIQLLEAQNEELRSLLDVLKYGSDEESLAALRALRSPQATTPGRRSSNLLSDVYGVSHPDLPSLSPEDIEHFRADQGSRQSGSPAQPSSWPSLRFFNYPSIFNPSQLPPEGDLRKGADIFLQVTAGLFHIMTMDEFDQLCDQAFRPISPPDTFIVAKICAVGAIGAHFNVDDTTGELKDALFHTAIHHISEMVELRNLQTVKYLACLCAYGMVDKRKSTARLIHLSLQIARWNMALPEHELMGDAYEWSRLYRTVTFFECWLSASLGYLNDMSEETEPLASPTAAISRLQDDNVTQIKAKEIMNLKARVCKASCGLDPPTEQTIRDYMTDLGAWYQRLPPHMTLTVLLNGDANPLSAAQQGALLLSHATYLGAVMMLHRRVLVSVSDAVLGRVEDTDIWSTPVQEHLAHSIEAARAIVRIFILLRFGTATTNMHVRCWICILETYTACTILLYNIAFRTIQHVAQCTEMQLDLERVATCLGMLKASALVDKVSHRMWVALAAVHHAVVVSTGHQRYPVSSLEVESRNLPHPRQLSSMVGSAFEQYSSSAAPSPRPAAQGCVSAIQAFKRASDMLRDPFGHGPEAGFRLLSRDLSAEALDWWSAVAA